MTGITVPADQVSGLAFFDAITGSSPEKRARRNEHSRIMASGDAEAMEAERQRCLDEAIAEMRGRADRYREEQLVEVEHLGPGRIAA